MNEEQQKKKHSPYFNAVLAVLGVAFLVTSFDSPLKFFEPPLVSVGPKDIKSHEFRILLAHTYTLTDFSNIKNQNMAILSHIINNELISLEADRMGIHASQKAAQESLKKRPIFLDEQGIFQEERLQKFLSASGLTLAQLIVQEQKVLQRTRLKQALLAQLTRVPQELIKLASIGAFQQRSGAYKKFPIGTLSLDSLTPPEKELKTLFNEKHFQSPEYRTYQVLHLSPASFISGKSTPSPQDMVAAQSTFEKMCIQIEDDLGAGLSLEEIANTRKLSSFVKTVTTDAQGRYPSEATRPHSKGNKKLAEIAFSLSPEDNVRPASLESGTFSIVKLEKINPPKALSFQEAYPLLVQEWAKKNKILENRALEKAKEYEKVFSGSSAAALQRLASKDPSVVWLPPQAVSQYDGMQNYVPPIIKESLSKMTPGQVTTVQDGENAYVVRLVSVTIPEYQKDAYRVTDLVKESLMHTLWDAFVAALAQKYPVHIHKNRLEGFFKKSY